MDSLQEAKFNMYRAVEALCDANASIVETIVAFRVAFREFKAKIAEIIAADQQKSTILTGIAVDKAQLKQALCQQSANIAGAIFAFAATTANNELKQQMNVSLSKLQKTSDNQLAARCQNIHDAGAANTDALADYGITAAMLTALQAAIDEYSSAAPKTRVARSRRKAIGGSQRELFKAADTILTERMDSLIGLLEAANPDFASTYKAAREIDDPNTTTTQLKGVVTGKADAAPIKGATVTIVELAKTTKTDAAGEYLFKPALFGKYTVRVTATGFDDFENDEVEVKLGTVNHLDIEL